MANKSANQCYKESKSELPFREWLRIEQENGKLENHEAMFNASGEMEVVEKPQAIPTAKASGMKISNMVGLVSAGVFAYGLYQEANK